MSFAVELGPAAATALRALSADVRLQILADIGTLAADPIGRPPRNKRLVWLRPPTYRLRSGAYRVAYRLAEAAVVVLAVIDRKDLERTIRRLR